MHPATSTALCLNLSLAACAGAQHVSDGTATSTPRAHVGPVSGLCTLRGELFSCSQSGVFVGGPRNLRALKTLSFRPCAIAAQSLERALLVAGGSPGASGEIALVRPGNIVKRITVSRDLVYDVDVAPDGLTAALACADGRVLRVDLPMLNNARELHAHTAACRAVAFSPDGTSLASGGLDGNLFVRSPDGSGPSTANQDHTAGIECLAYSADGHQLASGARDAKVRLHDSSDRRLIRTYQRLGAPVTAVCYHPRCAAFFVGLRDGRVLRLDPAQALTTEWHHFGVPVRALVPWQGGLAVGVSGQVEWLAPLNSLQQTNLAAASAPATLGGSCLVKGGPASRATAVPQSRRPPTSSLATFY